MSSERETNIRRAADHRRLAETEYREALEVARAAGATYTELGRFVGLTRQAVRQYLQKKGES
jgi:predicted transcriptional regulator